MTDNPSLSLRDWIARFPRMEREAVRARLASAANVSYHALVSYEKRKRRPPRAAALLIEAETGAAVTRYTLNPDIFGLPPQP